MPALKNIRWEKAALAYVETGNKTESYRRAGYSTKGTSKTKERLALRLFENEQVLNRVEELQQHMTNKAIITCEEKQQWLRQAALDCLQGKDYRTLVAIVAEHNKMAGDYPSVKGSQPQHLSLADFIDSLPD